MKSISQIVFFSFILLLSSCSKFEDGPWLSLRSEEKRIGGAWQLTYWTVDRVDSLQYWRNYFKSECTFNILPGGESNEIFVNWGYPTLIYYQAFCHYSTIEDKYLNIIYFNEDTATTVHPLLFMKFPAPTGDGVAWTITKLKFKDLWFEMDVNDKHYELHFENLRKY